MLKAPRTNTPKAYTHNTADLKRSSDAKFVDADENREHQTVNMPHPIAGLHENLPAPKLEELLEEITRLGRENEALRGAQTAVQMH